MKYAMLLNLLFFSILSSAQVSGNANYQQTEVTNNSAHADVKDGETTISISGLLNARADQYLAFFHVMQVGETAESTNELMNERIRKFRNALQEMEVDSGSVKTDIVSFVPRYDFNIVNKTFSKTYNEVPDGFELQRNISIRYEHPAQLDAIVTAAASAEIYDLVKVDYFLRDVKKQYDDLRQLCLQTLKDRMKSYELIGIKLDTLRKIISEDFGTNLPQNRYGQFEAVARPSLTAVKKAEGGASFKIRSADLTPSRYYQAVSYDHYDVVIDPVVDEPMVQLTYQVAIKFTSNAQRSTDPSLWIIGADGKPQRIELTSTRP